MTHKVSDFELVDHGIENPQYWQGVGVSGTCYNYCNTGVGDNPAEALDDLLECIATMGTDDGGSIDVEGLEERILEDLGIEKMPTKPSAWEEAEEEAVKQHQDDDPDADPNEDATEVECENNYYLSLRFNLADEENDG